MDSHYGIYHKQNIEVERIVIASILFSSEMNELSDLADYASKRLVSTDFMGQANRTIFEAIKMARGLSQSATIGNVIQHVSEFYHKDVYDLYGNQATIKDIESACSQLSSLGKLRRIFALADEAYKIYSTEDDSVKCLDGVLNTLAKVHDDSDNPDSEGKWINELGLEYMRDKESILGDVKRGLPTGLSGYDKQTGGLHPGQLIIVAALQKMGKTNFTLSIANNISLSGKKVCIFSLEMTKNEILDRLIPQRSSMLSKYRELEASKLITGNGLRGIGLATMSDVYGDMYSENGIFINTNPALDISELVSVSRRKHADGELDAIVLDYIQLLVQDNHNQRVEIANITRALKKLAQELKVPVIALSQINARDTKAGERPHKGQLSGSSSLESDADVIMFPWREQAIDNSQELDPSKSTLIIGAARGGVISDVEMHFNTNTTYFSSPDVDDKHGEPVENSRRGGYDGF